MKRLLYTTVFICSILACTPSNENPIVEVSGITVTPTALTLSVGERMQLIASVNPSNATNKEICWESDNNEVVIVDNQGYVAAFKEGVATITVFSSSNGVRATCSITVLPRYIAVEAIYLDRTELCLRKGDISILTPKILPENATRQKVGWESSDTSVVTVFDGDVTGVNPGQAIITANVDEKSAVCTVNVRERLIPKDASDLGLSVYWGQCNLGAPSPEKFGDYYSWGEIDTKFYYGWSNYRYSSGGSDVVLITKYCPQGKSEFWGGSGDPDDYTTLRKEDDVAFQKLGGNWRMPTIEEIGELINTQYNDNYEWTWDVLGNDNSGRTICGWTIRYKKNDNAITIPGASVTYTNGSSGTTYYWGCIWSSSLSVKNPRMASYSYINVQSDYSPSPFIIETCDRMVGLCIRPVSD